MPRLTEPVKRVYYIDDLTVWATGVKIPDLEDSLNGYPEEIMISARKSLVTLLTPDKHQANTYPRILIEDSQLLLVQCPKILGVYRDTSLIQQAYRLRSRENIQQKQYYQGLGRYILGPAEGNIADDIQDDHEIDHQLCCTCLEYKPTRH